MKLSFRTVFWGSAALIVIVLLVLAFRPRPVPVDMGEVMSGPMSVTVSDEGRTRIRDVYAVAAPVGGRLLRVAAGIPGVQGVGGGHAVDGDVEVAELAGLSLSPGAAVLVAGVQEGGVALAVQH